MNSTLALSAAAVCALTAAFCSPAEAAQASGGYRMEVLIDGRPVTEYRARNNTYIEAKASREYTIRLVNPTGRRVAVALSVDGMNTIDAKRTSAYEATKWVLGPWETTEIKGWQTSSASSRAFFFTTEEASYGNWMGQTDNLGIISAAFFPEVTPPPAPEPVWYWPYGGWDGDEESSASRSRDAYGDMPAPSAEASAPSAASGMGSAGASREATAKAKASDSMAATGIGRERQNRVSAVEMEIETSPAAVVSVRYEYRQELVRLGVLKSRPDPMTRREQSTGFEGMSFAPDPYGR